MASFCENENTTALLLASPPEPTGTAVFLTGVVHNRIVGTGVAWKFRNQSKGEFLAGNRTQTG